MGEARRQAEEDSSLLEWQEKEEKARAILEEEEEKLQATKKKLENLTGQPVKEMRSTKVRAKPQAEDRTPRRNAAEPRQPAPNGPCDEASYSYSDYSDCV